MATFVETIRDKNAVMFYFGLLMLGGAILTAILTQYTSSQIMGANAYLKPMKFYLSGFILAWTMGYFMQFLDNQKQVSIYNWVYVITIGYELLAITLQAALGKQSHFNKDTAFDQSVFYLMGFMITLVTLWTGYMTYLFFVQKEFSASPILIWSIRLGLLMTVVFAFQGGLMAALLRHGMGGLDGGAGLPLVNWSRHHGDLRVAHFFGIHAAQIIPFVSILFAKSIQHVFVIATIFFVFVTLTLIQAFLGKPFLNY
ncbi:MAG: hypothetical protein ACFCUU_19635 [Cyclobacteriaceae bacterium]